MIDIQKLLSLPEGRTLEFKQDLSSLQPILKTLVAFANTAGGVLIVGRDDEGKIIGIENVLASEEKLSNAITDNIYPPLLPEIEVSSVKGRPILIVRVPHWRGPFYLKSKGPVEGVYVRLGSTNRTAGPEILAELKRSITMISFDQLPCPQADETCLDKQRLKQAFIKIGKIPDSHKLETLGILVPYNGELVCSNGGLILFGLEEHRKRYFPNSSVRCARFQGTDKVNFIDQYEVEGTIIDAMREVTNFIKRNTRLGATVTGIERKNTPEYSPLIIREVLTNALVHSDYSIKGMNPRVLIFSDRLEIESPGMLPFGYTLEDFFSGVSHVRNKVIARVFREINLMEEWGTGYQRIQDTCRTENYPIPTWHELGTSIRVLLRPHTVTQDKTENQISFVKKEITPRQQEILEMFTEESFLTTKAIHKKMKTIISDRTLRGDLSLLKEKGFLQSVGKGPSIQWKKLQND